MISNNILPVKHIYTKINIIDKRICVENVCKCVCVCVCVCVRMRTVLFISLCIHHYMCKLCATTSAYAIAT